MEEKWFCFLFFATLSSPCFAWLQEIMKKGNVYNESLCHFMLSAVMELDPKPSNVHRSGK